jgi:hypothetical protein
MDTMSPYFVQGIQYVHIVHAKLKDILYFGLYVWTVYDKFRF